MGTADEYPEETEWSLKRNSTGVIEMKSVKYNINDIDYPVYSEAKCVGEGEYTFTILDAYEDGICCGVGNGTYNVFVDGVLQASGAKFGRTEEHSIQCIS